MTTDVASSPSRNSLLSFGTPTASSRIVFDALRKDLEGDENAGSSGSSSSSPSSPAKSSPSRPVNMSPSRKAILDRFANINKGPPPMTNTSSRTGAALGDASMSLLNMSSSRAGPNSSIADYDIMGAPDDSLLIKARQMGDESFDRRLLKGGSPEKREALRKRVQARASMAPRQEQLQHAAAERKSSPAKLQGHYPQQGNALGLGLPSSPAKNETRSFSTLSDTSNLFEEQGEQSLLYASMRVKPGADKGKLLGALAATPRQQAAAPLRSVPSSAKATKLATALGAGPSKAAGAQPSSAQRISGVTGRVLPPSTPSSTMTTPRARPSALARPTPTTAAATPRSAATPSSSSASTARTSRPIGVAATPRSRTTGSVTPRATPSSATPRSRPPLNASAARLRRLSGLPQLMDDDGNVKGKAPATPATAGPSASAAAARSSAIPQQQRPRSSIAATSGRPSLATGKALSSPRATHIARQAPGSAVKATSSRITASPSTSKIAGGKARPISMYAGSAASQRPSQPSPSRTSAVTGQLPPRRAPPTSISPPATNSHLPALSSTRKPPRPFLLGWGTNHTINGDSPTLQGDAALPEEAGEGSQGEKRTTVSPRKSIATSTLMRAPSTSRATTSGLPKSTSMGCVSSATPTPSSTSSSSGLPISRLARPSTASSRLPARVPGSTPAPAPGAPAPGAPAQLASSPPAQSTTSLARSGSVGGGAGPRQRSSSGFWKYNKTPTPPMGEERELAEE